MTDDSSFWAWVRGPSVAGALRCRFLGHLPLEQHILQEGKSLSYRAARDSKGRALSWPTCPRCGYMKVDLSVEQTAPWEWL